MQGRPQASAAGAAAAPPAAAESQPVGDEASENESMDMDEVERFAAERAFAAVVGTVKADGKEELTRARWEASAPPTEQHRRRWMRRSSLARAI